MPCRFRYVVPQRLLIQHFTCTLHLPQLLDHYDRVLGHPALPDTCFELTDMRNVAAIDIDMGTLANLVVMLSAEYLRRFDTFQRGAVIVNTSAAETAARMFQDALPAPVRPRYGVFRDSTAASTWLRLGRNIAAPRIVAADDAPHVRARLR